MLIFICDFLTNSFQSVVSNASCSSKVNPCCPCVAKSCLISKIIESIGI